MKREVVINGCYRHFKGNNYKILAIAQDSEEEQKKYVIYESLYNDHKVYAREYNDFISEVNRNKYPDIKQKYRFELIK